MARPMIEALEELGGPDALDLSSLFVLASTAAIFSPTVKDQYLELFPNLMIIDAIGSSETGVQRHAHGRQGRHAEQGRRPHRQRRARHRRARRELNEVAARDRSAGSPGPPRQRARSTTTRTPRSRRRPSSSVPTATRYALAGDMAILEDDGTITPPRARLAVHQLRAARRSSPRRSSRALKAHPAVFDAIVVGVPDERWGQRVAAVVQPRDGRVAHRSTTSPPTAVATLPGTRCPRRSTSSAEVVRSPSGKPDYPWAGKVARGEITV